MLQCRFFVIVHPAFSVYLCIVINKKAKELFKKNIKTDKFIEVFILFYSDMFMGLLVKGCMQRRCNL